MVGLAQDVAFVFSSFLFHMEYSGITGFRV
jgi:hypothetical protein